MDRIARRQSLWKRASSLLLLFALFQPRPILSQQGTPSISAIMDGYRLNFARMGGTHITWTCRFDKPDEYFEVTRHQIEDLEALLRGRLSKADRDLYERNLEQYKLHLGAARAREESLDFWVRGPNVQVRTWSERPRNATSFPASPLTAESLAVDYPNVIIASFLHTARPPITFWGGRSKGSAISMASRLSQTLDKYFSPGLFPPWGARHPKWGEQGAFSELDRLQDLPVEGFSPPKLTRFKGRNAWLLEHTSETPVFGFPEVTRQERTSAWVDTRRGFIPLRIERRAVARRAGQALLDRPYPVHLALEVTDIQQIGDGTYYPIAGTVTQFVDDPTAPFPTLQEQLDGKRNSLGARTVPYSKFEWHVDRIETNLNLPDSFFEIATFPTGTVVYDEVRREGHLVGVDEKNLAVAVRELAERHKKARTKSRVVTLYCASGSIFILTVVGLWWWRSRRKRYS